MIRAPYIFLSQNYAKYSVNNEQNEVSIKNIEIDSLPFVAEFTLTDKYSDTINRSIDTMLFSDTNIVNATIEYKENDEYHPLFTLSDNQDSTILVKNANPINVNTIRITIPQEGNPNIVRIGGFGFYKYVCDLFAETDSSFKVDSNSGSYRTLSGDIIYYGDYKKWESKIKISNLPKEQFDLLTQEIKETNELTIIPFKDFDFSAIYECYLSPEIEFTVNRKTELYELTLQAQEL